MWNMADAVAKPRGFSGCSLNKIQNYTGCIWLTSLHCDGDGDGDGDGKGDGDRDGHGSI